MFAGSDHDEARLLLTPTELAGLTPGEQNLLQALTCYFTPAELAVFTVDDLEFFLSLEHEGLPEIPPEEAHRVACLYRDRVRLKLA